MGHGEPRYTTTIQVVQSTPQSTRTLPAYQMQEWDPVNPFQFRLYMLWVLTERRLNVSINIVQSNAMSMGLFVQRRAHINLTSDIMLLQNSENLTEKSLVPVSNTSWRNLAIALLPTCASRTAQPLLMELGTARTPFARARSRGATGCAEASLPVLIVLGFLSPDTDTPQCPRPAREALSSDLSRTPSCLGTPLG